ncbi:MAG: hypothetical protein LBS05_10970 [Tannerellaceae bacterium]|jgi:hypothetical protein|nr:hypothetical protein [Tannerellaceae bacterium]
MKKLLFLVALLIPAGFCSEAQTYAPTTAWPFLYEDFRQGTVFFADGGRSQDRLLNVHLLHVTLWHRDGGELLLSDPKGIERVAIGADTFIYMNGQLARLVHARGEIGLVELVKGNFNALTAPATGAYGMNTQSSSAQIQTSIGQINYAQARLGEAAGRRLPLTRDFYFLFGDKIVRATRKEMEKAVPKENLPQLRSFIKTNRIRWDEAESLARFFDFFVYE